MFNHNVISTRKELLSHFEEGNGFGKAKYRKWDILGSEWNKVDIQRWKKQIQGE